MAPINWDECDLLPRFECSVCATTAVPWGRTPDDHYFCSSRCASATATATAATHDDTPSLPPSSPSRAGLRAATVGRDSAIVPPAAVTRRLRVSRHDRSSMTMR